MALVPVALARLVSVHRLLREEVTMHDMPHVTMRLPDGRVIEGEVERLEYSMGRIYDMSVEMNLTCRVTAEYAEKSGLTSASSCGKVGEVKVNEKKEVPMLNDPLVIPRTVVLEKLNAKLDGEKAAYEAEQSAQAEIEAGRTAKVAALAEAFPNVVSDALRYYGGAYATCLEQADPVQYLREQGYTPAASAAAPYVNTRLERMIAVLEAATNENLSLTPNDDLYGYLA
jgi:hypothetical protein